MGETDYPMIHCRRGIYEVAGSVLPEFSTGSRVQRVHVVVVIAESHCFS
jgi:hypothetical protein